MKEQTVTVCVTKRRKGQKVRTKGRRRIQKKHCRGTPVQLVLDGTALVLRHHVPGAILWVPFGTGACPKLHCGTMVQYVLKRL